MESLPTYLSSAAREHDNAVAVGEEEEEEEKLIPQVDQFLVEAIANPRHRLTVLRMELDIQRFMQNSDLHQYEFQHFPTSYLRCAAHRVAQHYGLQTVALDYTLDGLGSRIVATKTPDSKFPTICLSDIPTKQQPENDKTEKVKIAIRPRPNKSSMADAFQQGIERNPVRTVEEREEEYDKARARIFSGSCSPEAGSFSTAVTDDKRSLYSSAGGQECYRTFIDDNEKMSTRDGASRVAIFRDREKDMTDPDYDRSYNRYIRGIAPSHSFGVVPCNVLHPSPLQLQKGISHLGQLPPAQPLVSYTPPDPTVIPFSAVGCNRTPTDAVFMQWPTAMMYVHSFEHFRHASFQAPVYQQPLSFERWQNH